MFTGIIEKVGKVISAEDRRGQRRLLVKTGFTDLQNGESFAQAARDRWDVPGGLAPDS